MLNTPAHGYVVTEDLFFYMTIPARWRLEGGCGVLLHAAAMGARTDRRGVLDMPFHTLKPEPEPRDHVRQHHNCNCSNGHACILEHIMNRTAESVA